MSAFSGMGVDNAIVELDSFECPSWTAVPTLYQYAKDVGTRIQSKTKKLLVIKRPYPCMATATRMPSFLPASEFKITYSIDFPHPVIGSKIPHPFFRCFL